MRLRNVKNKEEILNNSPFLIRNSSDYLGKWKELFNNSNPIYIEIGMGKGDFIIENAIKNPDINFIGIEKFDSVIARACEKVPADLKNLILVRMDALDIDKAFNKEIDRIYLNFSDPWPKKRHADRRLTSHIFLNKYDSIFKNKKEIIQKTDNQSLFEYSIISLSTYGYIIEDISFDLHNSGKENIIMTEYEKKFTSKGNNIYYLIATKK
ncbi:MAG: tRNA (guanosine(46)-N7)-methyltransferase TrmB [Bacilli bacterium]|nr:tRNA (guanosine(46)-N7)-methyltransferase TrmB [Bacilli bacterium]